MCLSFTNHIFEVSFIKLILFLFSFIFLRRTFFSRNLFSLFNNIPWHTPYLVWDVCIQKFCRYENNRFNIVGSWWNTITSDDFSASNKIVFHSIYNLTYDEHLKSTLGEIEFSWRITNEDNTFTFHDHTNRFKVFMFYWELQSS